MFQIWSVKSCFCGRPGRLPVKICFLASSSVNSLNGICLVKTFNNRQTVNPSMSNTRRRKVRGLTSITTMAKEKTSASWVHLAPPRMTSGAVHLGVNATTLVTRTEFNSRTVEARPKSAKRARPTPSMRMLSYWKVINTSQRNPGKAITPFKSPCVVCLA